MTTDDGARVEAFRRWLQEQALSNRMLRAVDVVVAFDLRVYGQDPAEAGLSQRPPLGVVPRELWAGQMRQARLHELARAIRDYVEAGLELKPEWVAEYNQRVTDSGGETT